MTEDVDALLARSGTSSAFGKLDDVLDQMRIDSETKSRLQAMAAEAGMSLTEFVRMRLQAVAFGDEHVASVYAERIRRVLGLVG